MVALMAKWKNGYCDVYPMELAFTLGVLTSVPIFVKIDQGLRP